MITELLIMPFFAVIRAIINLLPQVTINTAMALNLGPLLELMPIVSDIFPMGLLTVTLVSIAFWVYFHIVSSIIAFIINKIPTINW